VNNIASLDDIFHKKPETVTKEKKAKERGLDDSEVAEDVSEDHEIQSHFSEASTTDEIYEEDHNLKKSEESQENGEDHLEESSHVYDPDANPFHIQDLEKVTELVEKIKEDIKSKILGDLQNIMMIKQLDITYEVYEEINQVRKRYFFFKDSIEQSTQLLKDMVDYLEEFVTDSEDDESIQQALKDKGIEIDEHNHKLLVGLLIKLQQLVNKLHEEVFDTFNDYFKELNSVHFNDEISDSEKIRKMVQTASEISIFENSIVDDLSGQIMEVARLSLDNPRYDHLSKAFEKEFHPPGEVEGGNHKLSRSASTTIYKSFVLSLMSLIIFF
jgi:hypothetical protein